MGLSKADQERLRTFLNSKVTNWSCAMCRNDKWEVNTVLKVELGDLGSGSAWDASTVPFAVLACTNCGHAVFFHLGRPGAEIAK